MDIKNKVFNFIQKHPGTTFIELERLFEEHNFPYKGEKSITNGENENLIMWVDWNEQAISTISELLSENKITAKHSENLVYLIDGKALNLPIAKSVRNYKKLRWLPIVFNVTQ